MYLPNVTAQQVRFPMYDASGTIATGGTAQLIVPEHKSRSSFLFINNSDTVMYLGVGAPLATASLTSGVVTSVSIVEGGFGYTIPPNVTFVGGGNDGWDMNNSTTITPGQPSYPSPANAAAGTCVLTGGAVSSISLSNGGANYKNAPYVWIHNSLNDQSGCFKPGAGTLGSVLIAANGGNWRESGTSCTTDAIAVYCASTGKAFTFKFTL